MRHEFRGRLWEKLEERVLFDAAPVSPAGDIENPAQKGSGQSYDVEHLASDMAQTSDGQQDGSNGRRELIFVDANVDDFETLIDGLGEDSSFELIFLDADANGLEQIARELESRSGIDAIHLLSHSDDAELLLGDASISAASLTERYAGELLTIGNALNTGGDILLYGCDLAATADGEDFVSTLAELTGADVAASSDDTGHAARGGDWDLEYRTGAIEASAPFTAAAQSSWQRLLAAGPQVRIEAPSQVQIGSDVNVSLVFENIGASGDTGYAPFIDLIIPHLGADGLFDGDAFAQAADGLDIAADGAITYLGQNVDYTVLTFPDDDGAYDNGGTLLDLSDDTGGSSLGVLVHPLARDANGDPLEVYGRAGDKLVVIELPFGSFTTEQPAAELDVALSLSASADLNLPLTLSARAGFSAGADPLDNPADDPSILSGSSISDSSNWAETHAITPTLISVQVSYDDLENETATGPGFPRRITLTVDIPAGQTVTDLDIISSLPDNIVLASLDEITSTGGAANFTTNIAAALNNTLFTGSNGLLPVDLSGPVSGQSLVVTADSITGIAGADATVTFSYYVPEFDANGERTIPLNGEDDNSGSQSDLQITVAAQGDWTPLDARDTGGAGAAVAAEVTLGAAVQNKSIAIQKSVEVVTDNGAAGASPGDILEYTLSFQVSDYFTFGDLLITDVMSDGQRYDFGTDATFSVSDRNGAITDNFDVRLSTAADAGETLVIDETTIATGGDEPGLSQTTTLTFDLSQALIASGAVDGVLQGGLAAGGGGQTATGTITFRAIVLDEFSEIFEPGDRSVDQGDLLTNTVSIAGTVRDNLQISRIIGAEETGGVEEDDSAASISIVSGGLTKSIYAVNGSTTLPAELAAGDLVTYSLEYELPTSDIETLTLIDYLPLPVFEVLDPDQNGEAGPAWTFNAEVSAFDRGRSPVAGVIELGARDTFYDSQARPAEYFNLVTEANANSIAFEFGSYDDPASPSNTIHLLFTVRASDAQFAGGLNLTNFAQAVSGATNATPGPTAAIAQIELVQPALEITKGVVATSRDNEIQQIYTTGAVAGDFTITFGGLTTSNISTGADAATVQAALESLLNTGPGNVRVTGGPLSSATPLEIEFTGDYRFTDVPEITVSGLNLAVQTVQEAADPNELYTSESAPGASYNQTQQLTITGNATGGLFTLTFDSQTTLPLVFDAPAIVVQAALELLPSIDAGDITVSGTLDAGLTIEFGGQYEGAPVPDLIANNISLISAIATAETQQLVFTRPATGGVYRLIYNGVSTADIAYNATAPQLKISLKHIRRSQREI